MVRRERLYTIMRKRLIVFFIVMFCILSGCNSKSLQSKATDSDKANKESIQDDLIQIPVDEEYTIDLNNDSKEDTVIYTLSSKKPYEGNITSFKVNGVEYVDKLPELGIYMNNPNWEWYYIVDIDESDNFKEIAILDEGPSSDPETYFLRLDGDKLKFIGSVTDFPQSKTCEFIGDGTIIASSRLSILQTWFAPTTWRIDNNDLLQKVKEDMYYPYVQSTSNEMSPILIKDFMLYTEPNLEAKQVKALASNKVTFVFTDDIHWVFMKCEDGTEGWFYTENYNDILYEGDMVTSSSIFDNLAHYD